MRARGGVHARACVALLTQHAARMRDIVSSLVAPLAPPNFSTISHKRHDFWRGGGPLMTIKCFYFWYKFCEKRLSL